MLLGLLLLFFLTSAATIPEAKSGVNTYVKPVRIADHSNACSKARLLLETIRQYHIDAPADDSELSKRLFVQLVHQLDPQGLYLTKANQEKLQPLFRAATSAILAGDCKALSQTATLFERQYYFVDSLRLHLLEFPLKLKGDTLLLSLTASTTYAPNNTALVKRWQKQLAYLVLHEAYAEAGAEDIPLSLQQEKRLRAQVKEKLLCRKARMMQRPGGVQGYVEEQFLQALATSFDPHTNYLPASQHQNFVASLSVDAESFGIEVEENPQGAIQIARLVPGGPAWRSNELHEGDVLLQIKSKQAAVKEFSCTDAEEASELLNDAAYKHAYLTVRKKSGQTKTVALTKEKLTVEENVVTSFILQGDRKIGYISLPAFYTEMDGMGNRGAASDVAKAIVELKRAGIEGLMLDLRFNGGGAVDEAATLAGMFVDEGPLGIALHKNAKPSLLKDPNRGVLYAAPLLIIVNGFSASASEIMAQALQHYNRALLVGMPTYGKATIQTIIPLDEQGLADNKNGEEAFVKVTIGKYYGVKRNSYQAKGLQPDVMLQDGLAAFNQHESTYPTALKADSIDKQALFRSLPALPAAELRNRSEKRLADHVPYTRYKQQANKFAMANVDGFPIRLQAEHFKEDYQQLLQMSDALSAPQAIDSTTFQVQNLPSAIELLEARALDQDTNKLLQQSLQQDLWLTEAYHIMLDLISLQKQ